MNTPSMPSKVRCGENLVRTDPHLLVLNYFVLLVVLAPPRVLIILWCLTSLSLLIWKRKKNKQKKWRTTASHCSLSSGITALKILKEEASPSTWHAGLHLTLQVQLKGPLLSEPSLTSLWSGLLQGPFRHTALSSMILTQSVDSFVGLLSLHYLVPP